MDISVGKERGDKYQAQYNYKGEKIWYVSY